MVVTLKQHRIISADDYLCSASILHGSGQSNAAFFGKCSFNKLYLYLVLSRIIKIQKSRSIYFLMWDVMSPLDFF